MLFFSVKSTIVFIRGKNSIMNDIFYSEKVLLLKPVSQGNNSQHFALTQYGEEMHACITALCVFFCFQTCIH